MSDTFSADGNTVVVDKNNKVVGAEDTVDDLVSLGQGRNSSPAFDTGGPTTSRPNVDSNGAEDDIGSTSVELRDPVQLDEFARLNVKDVNGNGQLRPGEAGAAVEIQNLLGGSLRRTEVGEKGDFIFTSGSNNGKTVDFLFTADTPKSAQAIDKFFDKNPSNLTQIKSHVEKADIVPIDMRHLSSDNRSKVTEFIRTLSKEEQSKIILIE